MRCKYLIKSVVAWPCHEQRETSVKKIRFLASLQVIFQLCLIYKSFIRPCMEYCCHVGGAVPKTTLDLLDKVQNRAIRLINDSGITNKLDSLKHRRDVADLTIFYKYSYGHCSKEVSKIMRKTYTWNKGCNYHPR